MGDENYAARSGRIMKSDGSTINEADLLTGIDLVLLTNSTSTGTSSAKPVAGFKTYRFEAWGTGTYTLQINGIGASGTGRPLPIWDITNKSFVAGNSITAAGFYEVDVQGFTSIQSNVPTITGGNVNASGRLMA